MNEKFLDDVRIETNRAMLKHGPLNSLHEAYAIILEEVDEFKSEVWKKSENRDKANIRMELIQIAAMCCRTVIDMGL